MEVAMAIGQKHLSVSRLVPALMMLILLQACSRDLTPAAAGPKGNNMQAAEIIINNETLRPPIDLNTPAGIATATFGLG
jgi:hypothetical protein